MENLNKLSRKQIEEMCSDSKWFHSINFGDFQSAGRFKPSLPQNITLYGTFDILNKMNLKGKKCMDVGSADGITSFGMKALGAEKVTAIDSFDIKTFRLARHLLQEDIEYFPRTQIKDLDTDKSPVKDKYDVIVCAGVIYHMLNPLSAFIKLRKTLKNNGILIMESPYYKDSDDAIMVLNSESPNYLKELYTYWVPTRSAIEGMMKLVGFDIIGVRVLKNPSRITFIGQVKEDLNEIRNRPSQLVRMHEVDYCDFEFRFQDLDKNVPTSDITADIKEHEVLIDSDNFPIKFPYHPELSEYTNPKGRTRWLSQTKNW